MYAPCQRDSAAAFGSPAFANTLRAPLTDRPSTSPHIAFVPRQSERFPLPLHVSSAMPRFDIVPLYDLFFGSPRSVSAAVTLAVSVFLLAFPTFTCTTPQTSSPSSTYPSKVAADSAANGSSSPS